MSPPRTLLIFDLGDARFGVDATLVRESVWLPELTPIEEAPPYIAGILNLRGQFIPVTDLNLRFGHPAQPYRLSDQIVVLELDHLLMGLIVSEVIEVIELSAEAIQPPPKFDGETHRHTHLVAGEVRVGDDIVTLLDASQLMHQPHSHPNLLDETTSHSTKLPKTAANSNSRSIEQYRRAGFTRRIQMSGGARPTDYFPIWNKSLVTPQAEEGTTPPSQPSPALHAREGALPLPPLVGEGWDGGSSGTEHPAHHFCPEATPKEHAVFRARAKALMETTAEEEGARLSLAVVELDGEYFGIELHAVQEFCDIAQPSPIPCCPPHILGAISLRGNLFTLLDLRAALNLPRASQSSGKAVIARASTRLNTGLGEQVIGVAVDEVHDVVYLREEELQATPPALREQHGAEVKGTAHYGGKMMAVLDLPALLAREEWIVNETVMANSHT